MNEHKALIGKLLEAQIGDDLARAWVSFKGKSYGQMLQEYGESGKSCFAILGEYISHERKYQLALAWLERAEVPDER